MTSYLLDTGPLTAYLLGRPSAIKLIKPWMNQEKVATSILVYGEVIEYIKGLPNYPRNHKQLLILLQTIVPYFLTFSILERYADIRRGLRPPYGKGLIGDMDTLIASTTIERNLTLVTTDYDFERVPGLKIKIINLKD